MRLEQAIQNFNLKTDKDFVTLKNWACAKLYVLRERIWYKQGLDSIEVSAVATGYANMHVCRNCAWERRENHAREKAWGQL